MCSAAWLTFNFYAETVGFILSVILNVILLTLIKGMPNKVFGNYKYLMFSFSALGVVYSCIDFIVKPVSSYLIIAGLIKFFSELSYNRAIFCDFQCFESNKTVKACGRGWPV